MMLPTAVSRDLVPQPAMGWARFADAQPAGDTLCATYCPAGPSCYDMIIHRLHLTKMRRRLSNTSALVVTRPLLHAA